MEDSGSGCPSWDDSELELSMGLLRRIGVLPGESVAVLGEISSSVEGTLVLMRPGKGSIGARLVVIVGRYNTSAYYTIHK